MIHPHPDRASMDFALSGWLIIAAVLFFAVVAGLHLRWWAFQISDPIRFIDDDTRGSYLGIGRQRPRRIFESI